MDRHADGLFVQAPLKERPTDLTIMGERTFPVFVRGRGGK